MAYTTIDVDPSIGAVGALVSGVDLSAELAAETVAELRHAWLQHHILFFRDQDLAPAQQAQFAANFGELDVYPFMNALDAHANVIPIIKEPESTLNFGGAWHTDTSYLAQPPKATVLYGVEVPDEGGDTLFANATRAYVDLSDGLKQTLESLSGIYTARLVHGSGGGYNQVAAMSDLGESYGGDQEFAHSEVEHPLIQTHPDTGNKSIFCSKPHTDRIKGWSREESLTLLSYLADHMTRPEYVYRFKWQRGSLAIWDNRCVFHNALNDYQGKRRHMHRVIVRGGSPK